MEVGLRDGTVWHYAVWPTVLASSAMRWTVETLGDVFGLFIRSVPGVCHWIVVSYI